MSPLRTTSRPLPGCCSDRMACSPPSARAPPANGLVARPRLVEALDQAGPGGSSCGRPSGPGRRPCWPTGPPTLGALRPVGLASLDAGDNDRRGSSWRHAGAAWTVCCRGSPSCGRPAGRPRARHQEGAVVRGPGDSCESTSWPPSPGEATAAVRRKAYHHLIAPSSASPGRRRAYRINDLIPNPGAPALLGQEGIRLYPKLPAEYAAGSAAGSAIPLWRPAPPDASAFPQARGRSASASPRSRSDHPPYRVVGSAARNRRFRSFAGPFEDPRT